MAIVISVGPNWTGDVPSKVCGWGLERKVHLVLYVYMNIYVCAWIARYTDRERGIERHFETGNA
jgi:hypothetical protein